MTENAKKTVGLFFTYGVSLSLWKRKGMLERELALYKKLGAQGYRFFFFTYAQDKEFEDELRQYGITICPKKLPLPNFLYSMLIARLYKKELKQVDLIKTNQMHGSWAAVKAKKLAKKPLIVRTGYTFSLFAKKRSHWRYQIARRIEDYACKHADRLIVPTKEDQAYMAQYGVEPVIIPNYVDTELFVSKVKKERGDMLEILYVGRLEPQKNLDELIKGLADLSNIHLTIIGEGSLEAGLRQRAEFKGVNVTFLGHQPHEQLPSFFAKSDMFVLPSLYEGLPKVLLEAMAAAMPIVTTDVDGIRTVVEHKKTAIVVSPIAEQLGNGIRLVQAEPEQAQALGAAAREEILAHYSLNYVITREIEQYETIG